MLNALKLYECLFISNEDKDIIKSVHISFSFFFNAYNYNNVSDILN